MKSDSEIVNKTKEMMDKSMEGLGGLDETSIKVLHFFLKEVAGFETYRLNVLFDRFPKQVVVHVYDENGHEYYLKPKDNEVLRALADKMGVPNYVIRFAGRGEDYGS